MLKTTLESPETTRSRSDLLRGRLAGAGHPLLLDGATGTELERAGLPTGLPLWSTHALLEAPERVWAIHAAYLRAGAEVITANTFRTQRRTLARAALGDRDAELTRRAVTLARAAIAEGEGEAGDRNPPARGQWVAGSLAPLEDCYRPDLLADDASLDREHGRQAMLLGDAGVDLILIETMNTIAEARVAARAAARTGLPFAVGFVSWEAGRLLSGESLEDAALESIDLGAACVGVNCVPPASLEASRAALVRIDAGLLVSPNLGLPDEHAGFARCDEAGPNAFPDLFDPWLECNARIIGGCCGTTPSHIAALAQRLASR
ncbi:MAG: homocysteine methyltransferase [Deltaproteobacteria bacterium]|jgi:S-methylmethionine-dependent homocysteine/selenocysteine methylase|nr:homocysteine methyltransferase [Deltaproteobacteria bacterium]